jgi:hypothetical protein
MLTSAVGPADVSVDRSTVKGQGGPRSTGPNGQPHPEADRRAPRVRPEQEKEGGLGLGRFWAKRGDGPARGPAKLG